jgi:tight adherence protein B
MDILLPVLIFLSILILIEVGYFGLRTMQSSEKRGIRARLRTLSIARENYGKINILRKDSLSEISWLSDFLSRFSSVGKMTLLVEQAGGSRTPGFYLLTSLTLGVIGILIGFNIHAAYFRLIPSIFVVVPWAAGLAALPILYLRYKRRKRFYKFEEQLPEALELIARSLKAGHAFSTGLRLVAEEMEDPVSIEFAKTLNEVNFGVANQDAMINLTNRIPLDDLRFFVISVVLQRETGGNLAEILESLSHLIRERFKLHGRIHVLSAQARISAYILIAVPFFTAVVIHLINPRFFDAFLENPSGKYVLGFGVTWMIIGILAMKKLITIRV